MSSSIFKDDWVKPGIYKVQSVVSEGFVDVDPNTKIFTCKTSSSAEWQVVRLGEGYSISKLKFGGPPEFPTVLAGKPDKEGRVPVTATEYTTTWRVEKVTDPKHPNSVRFFWAETSQVWDLSDYGHGEIVNYKDNNIEPGVPNRIWKLVHV